MADIMYYLLAVALALWLGAVAQAIRSPHRTLFGRNPTWTRHKPSHGRK
jgi:hypothetical protein